jgi:hypothetical protein
MARSIRSVIALPFWLVSVVAFLLLGFQLLLAVLNLLNGVRFVDALTVWLTNTVVLTVVGVVAAIIGAFVGGSSDD